MKLRGLTVHSEVHCELPAVPPRRELRAKASLFFGGTKSAKAESRHSSPALWFDSAHHPELAEGRLRFSPKEDKQKTAPKFESCFLFYLAVSDIKPRCLARFIDRASIR